MRTFNTGATRDSDDTKLDYEGFLSPLALERYAQYMHKHRIQADGGMRDSDNWQKGIPKEAYIKSLWRHFMDVWKEHRGLGSRDGLQEALCALIFNAMGYLHEDVKQNNVFPPGKVIFVHDLERDTLSPIVETIKELEKRIGSTDDSQKMPALP